MAPTAAMLLLSYRSNPFSPPQTTFRISVSGGKRFSRLDQPQESVLTSNGRDGSSSLEERFRKALELSCWSL
ncbi:hypothetical protein ACLOJK_003245 [Asimina triloba]